MMALGTGDGSSGNSVTLNGLTALGHAKEQSFAYPVEGCQMAHLFQKQTLNSIIHPLFHSHLDLSLNSSVS
ncbi:uncharacterized protein VTP21DRAFT_5465 [Calcarisporiella thermophila]|uniref:uncharacterized protein n=1 Tax=Calcarisporiella thermophila TaxID=911321 RepID=UPI003742E608